MITSGITDQRRHKWTIWQSWASLRTTGNNRLITLKRRWDVPVLVPQEARWHLIRGTWFHPVRRTATSKCQLSLSFPPFHAPLVISPAWLAGESEPTNMELLVQWGWWECFPALICPGLVSVVLSWNPHHVFALERLSYK